MDKSHGGSREEHGGSGASLGLKTKQGDGGGDGMQGWLSEY